MPASSNNGTEQGALDHVSKEEGGVLKVDDQKEDDAEVPVHLQDSIFVKARLVDPRILYTLASSWREGLHFFRQA